MAFRVGQKVVCVKGSKRKGGGVYSEKSTYSHPDIGDVCTIATINHWARHTLLTFDEHDNSHLCNLYGYLIEPGFDSRCFRPVVERKTDISALTALLNPANHRELV